MIRADTNALPHTGQICAHREWMYMLTYIDGIENIWIKFSISFIEK